MNDQNDQAAHPPRGEDQERTCARACCSRPVPESLGTRPRLYCSRSCRQRAYEERRVEEQIREARAAAAAAAVLRERQASRDADAAARATSRVAEPTSRDTETVGGQWVASGLTMVPVWVPDRR